MAKRRRTIRRTVRRVYRGVRRRSPKRISLAVGAGLIAGLAKPAELAMKGQIWGENGALENLVYNYTGIQHATSDARAFNLEGLKNGMLPLVAGVLVHKGISMLGVNKQLAKMPSPFNKISI